MPSESEALCSLIWEHGDPVGRSASANLADAFAKGLRYEDVLMALREMRQPVLANAVHEQVLGRMVSPVATLPGGALHYIMAWHSAGYDARVLPFIGAARAYPSYVPSGMKEFFAAMEAGVPVSYFEEGIAAGCTVREVMRAWSAPAPMEYLVAHGMALPAGASLGERRAAAFAESEADPMPGFDPQPIFGQTADRVPDEVGEAFFVSLRGWMRRAGVGAVALDALPVGVFLAAATRMFPAATALDFAVRVRQGSLFPDSAMRTFVTWGKNRFSPEALELMVAVGHGLPGSSPTAEFYRSLLVAGVPPEFLRGARSVGLRDADKIVEAFVSGVPVEYLMTALDTGDARL